jgi:predicted phosphoribosyltransferase
MLDEAETKKLSPEVVAEEVTRQREEVIRRAKKYRGDKAALPSTDKIAIIVDDGITTGFNILPAVQLIKSQHPKKIVVAIPVAPRHSLEKVREIVDEIVILLPPETFGASVDEHYQEFAQPDDDAVIAALAGPAPVVHNKPFAADLVIPREGPEPFFSSDT